MGDAPDQAEQPFPGKLLVSHDAAAVKEHHCHQQDGEDDHAEAGTEQWDVNTGNGQRIVKETQCLAAGSDHKGSQHAACHASDAAQDHDQQDVVCKGHLKGLGINGAHEHGQHSSAHACEKGGDDKGKLLVVEQVDRVENL